MSPFAWAAAGAVVGLSAALVLVRKGLLPAWLAGGGSVGKGRGGSPVFHGQAESEAGARDTVRVRLESGDLKPLRDDIQGLHVLRTDIQRVGELLERLMEEAAFQRTRVEPPRPEPEPAGGPARDAFREPVRGTSPDPSPMPGATWRQGGRGFGMEVQHDERGGGFDPNLDAPAPARGDPAYRTPVAHINAPPADAVNVEAKDDTVIPSPRHPAEAWLERTGGRGEVWLNPQVPLTDPALQRWSTFFNWERRAPGSRYHATQPAIVSWSGNAGTVLHKGEAKPL